MCVNPTERYTAEAALKDPWILGDDWTEAHVDSLLAELDDSTVSVVPASYTEEEWLRAAAAIAQDADDGSPTPELEPEPQQADEEDGF